MLLCIAVHFNIVKENGYSKMSNFTFDDYKNLIFSLFENDQADFTLESPVDLFPEGDIFDEQFYNQQVRMCRNKVTKQVTLSVSYVLFSYHNFYLLC